ncbi:MAG: HU family DNA-binding protein [Acidovorax sp.]
MATAKKAAPATKAAAAPKAQKAPPASKAATPIKPIKEVLSKTALVNQIAEQAGVEAKTVKAVLVALDAAILGSVNKKGVGTFTLPGLLKLDVVKVPAKPKRKGIDPFTKEERVFAAKPASVKIKARALKKLKDAAL